MFRERYLVPQNIGERCIPVLALEGSGAVEHLVHENAQGPPIHGAGVAAALDDFGSNVFFRSNKGVRSEIGDTGFGVNRRERGRRGAISTDYHGWSAPWI